MDDITRNALAREAETAALIAELDEAFAAWCRSTEQLQQAALEALAAVDAVESELADAKARLAEWDC
jgi:hypothetical protein